MNHRNDNGMALVAALLLMALLFLLGTALLSMSQVEYRIAGNDEWAEGALHAAEAGVQTAIDRLSFDTSAATAPVPLATIGEDYTFRTGGREDTVAQPVDFVGATTVPGFTANSGTGYNPSGYVFLNYRIEATGGGPRNAQRELEVLAQYGPLRN